eukprot:scaffold61532_cov37-Phaeocystis_antarctica.AAC.1
MSRPDFWMVLAAALYASPSDTASSYSPRRALRAWFRACSSTCARIRGNRVRVVSLGARFLINNTGDRHLQEQLARVERLRLTERLQHRQGAAVRLLAGLFFDGEEGDGVDVHLNAVQVIGLVGATPHSERRDGGEQHTKEVEHVLHGGREGKRAPSSRLMRPLQQRLRRRSADSADGRRQHEANAAEQSLRHSRRHVTREFAPRQPAQDIRHALRRGGERRTMRRDAANWRSQSSVPIQTRITS